MKYQKPTTAEFPAYYLPFIKMVEQDDAIDAMWMVQAETQAFYRKLTDDQANFRYAPDNWSIKELLGHLIDCERIYQYRALCIARGEKTSLPGFEQDLYVTQSNASSRTIESLMQDFEAVRQSSISLFKSFTEEMHDNVGNANGYDMTVRAIAFIVPGHEKHHLEMVKERYLPKLALATA